MARFPGRTRARLAAIALPALVAVALPLLIIWLAFDDRSFAPVGLVPMAAGAMLLSWCIRRLEVTSRPIRGPLEPRRLVTVGPYRRSRNPIYLAVGLILVGWAIAFASWSLAGYALVALAILHVYLVRVEEPGLAREYGTEWSRYATRVPRWAFPSRQAVVLTWIALLAAIPVAGLFFEAYADARAGRDFPPPGTFVDVGGRRLHLLCLGEGAPIVMLEPGEFGAGSLSSTDARDSIARHTRVCSYDRAGTGWSDSAPGAMSAGDLARDMAVLQDRADLSAPFILVASSIGGLTIEMFARQFPERVAGLVFLDATTSGSLRDRSPDVGRARTAATAGSIAAHLGLVRWLDPLHIPADSEEGRRTAAMTYGSKAIDGLAAMIDGLPRSLQEFEDAPPLPADVPLVVLSASKAEAVDLRWPAQTIAALSQVPAASHQAFAKASSRGVWHLVPDSDHLIAVSQPDAVVDTVVPMIEAVRGATAVRARRR